jgi:hypothetical protein
MAKNGHDDNRLQFLGYLAHLDFALKTIFFLGPKSCAGLMLIRQGPDRIVR